MDTIGDGKVVRSQLTNSHHQEHKLHYTINERQTKETYETYRAFLDFCYKSKTSAKTQRTWSTRPDVGDVSTMGKVARERKCMRNSQWVDDTPDPSHYVHSSNRVVVQV